MEYIKKKKYITEHKIINGNLGKFLNSFIIFRCANILKIYNLFRCICTLSFYFSVVISIVAYILSNKICTVSFMHKISNKSHVIY